MQSLSPLNDPTGVDSAFADTTNVAAKQRSSCSPDHDACVRQRHHELAVTPVATARTACDSSSDDDVPLSQRGAAAPVAPPVAPPIAAPAATGEEEESEARVAGAAAREREREKHSRYPGPGLVAAVLESGGRMGRELDAFLRARMFPIASSSSSSSSMCRVL